MAEIDALSVSSGPNRGEAAFLGESTFNPVDLAWRVGQQAKKARETQRMEQADNMALLNDKVKTEWDSDTYNYFQPKVEALRGSIMDAMKESKGRLSPLQKMQFKGAWDELKSEADVNNTLWKSYTEQVKRLEEDPQGEKWDRNISTQKLQMFRDPYSVPELKAEIQQKYGGDVNKWRTANYQRFGLEPSFNFDKYIGDVTKDEKPQDYTVMDKDGKPIEGVYKTGEHYITRGKRFSKEQVDAIANRVWNETNYKSERAKQDALAYAENNFQIMDNGAITFDSSLTDGEKRVAQKAIQYAGDLKGLKPEEIKRKLAKGYIAATADIKGDLGTSQQQLGFKPQPARSSGGGGFTEKYTVTTTPYKTGGGIKEFNEKYGANAPENAQRLNTHQNAKIIAIEPTAKGSDSESFQLSFNGKQVRPVHYIVDENGGVFGVFSESVQVAADNGYGQPKYEMQVKEYELKPRELANIAAQYGFGGDNGVDNFKKQALGMSGQSKAAKVDLSKFDKTNKK